MKSPAFRFYAADFLMDEKVRLMNLQERGAYITLLAHCWIEKSIPSNPVELALLCNVDPRDFEGIWMKVSKCFRRRGSRMINNRLKIERSKQLEFSRLQRDKGRKSHVSDGAAVKPRLKFGQSGVNHARGSLSLSFSSSVKHKPLTPFGELDLPPDLKNHEPEIKAWLAYKREKGQGYKPKGLAALWGSLRKIEPALRKASIEQSMANNWAGIFQVKGAGDGLSSISRMNTAATQDRRAKWRAAGLSPCHGRVLEVHEHDGIKRCAECLIEYPDLKIKEVLKQ